MSIKKIVLAYDGSEDGKYALEWSTSYAKQISAEVIIASVFDKIPTLQIEDGSLLLNFEQVYRQGLEKMLKESTDVFRQEKIPVSTTILEGNPADEIMCYAAKQNADLIICGTRGLGGFSTLLLGSVAHKLVTYSTVPVLVVRRPTPLDAHNPKIEVPS